MALLTSQSKAPRHTPNPDFEFLNGPPAKDPATIWLHSYHSATSQAEHSFPPGSYQQVTGRRTTVAEEFHTFKIDWQPSHVAWCALCRLTAGLYCSCCVDPPCPPAVCCACAHTYIDVHVCACVRACDCARVCTCVCMCHPPQSVAIQQPIAMHPLAAILRHTLPHGRYLDGALLQREVWGEGGFITPNKPMFFMASIWWGGSRVCPNRRRYCTALVLLPEDTCQHHYQPVLGGVCVQLTCLWYLPLLWLHMQQHCRPRAKLPPARSYVLLYGQVITLRLSCCPQDGRRERLPVWWPAGLGAQPLLLAAGNDPAGHLPAAPAGRPCLRLQRAQLAVPDAPATAAGAAAAADGSPAACGTPCASADGGQQRGCPGS